VELNRMMSVFVSGRTSDYSLRYRLPGGGYLQKRGPDSRYGAVKAAGYWDVAFPLEDYGAMLAGNDVDMSYMTVAELDKHIKTVVQQNWNTYRYETLRALSRATNGSFTDPLHGALTIRRLANATSGSDTTVYPPVIGSQTEATEDHYLTLGAAGSSIADAEDPWDVTSNTNSIDPIGDLEHHFGHGAGSAEIVSFINGAQVGVVMSLTDVEPVEIAQIGEGTQTALARGVPANLPGVVLGRHRAGSWIVRWDWIPTNYILLVHTGVEAPLKERIDPAETGLGAGLQLIAENEEFPFKEMIWRHRFGLGVANRLNGVWVYCATGTTWSDPTVA
jgi:hypothetical protein